MREIIKSCRGGENPKQNPPAVAIIYYDVPPQEKLSLHAAKPQETLFLPAT